MWKELYLSSWEMWVCFLLSYSLCRDSSQVFWLQIEISVWQQDADKCWLAVPDYLPAIYFLMSSSGSDMRDSMHKPFWVNRCKLEKNAFLLFCRPCHWDNNEWTVMLLRSWCTSCFNICLKLPVLTCWVCDALITPQHLLCRFHLRPFKSVLNW